MRHAAVLFVLAVSAFASAADPGPVKVEGGYAVVTSEATRDDADWGPVVKAMAAKYDAPVVTYKKDVTDARDALAAKMPRYAAFVVRPGEAGRAFVVAVHRMTRTLDDDPYTDCLWGIVTGYAPADAMRIVNERDPLTIKRGLGGTAIPLGAFESGTWFSEGEAGLSVTKADGKEERHAGPADSTRAIVDVFNKQSPQFFLTSGHATERDWQMGYSYPNGQFRCKDGKLVGIDLESKGYAIDSPNPKVYVAAGNCLMGHVKDKQSMALAFMSTGGVRQMVGYTVSTWFGYGGWGVNDYFLGRPGVHSLAESFYFNNQALVNRLETEFKDKPRAELRDWSDEHACMRKLPAALGYRGIDDKSKQHVGLMWDRDTVAFYGDPAWDARLAPKAEGVEQKIAAKDGILTFEFKSGSKTGLGRPIATLLPYRVKNVKVTEGADLKPVITDNFIFLPNLKELEAGKTYRVVFGAEKIASN